MTASGVRSGRPVTQVAVGVLVRADGAVLLADRPAGKPYAGYWEFPGGKIEPGESVEQALARELAEELGVQVRGSLPWTVIEYDYPHAYVRLHFRRIFDWDGAPRSVEGQRLHFHRPGATPPAPLLPAAVAPLRWIRLRRCMARRASDAGDAAAAVTWLQDALARPVRPGPLARNRNSGGRARRRLARGVRAGPGLRGAAVCPMGLRAKRHAAARRRRHLPACRAAARPNAGAGGRLARCGRAERGDLARAAALGCDFAVWESDGAVAGSHNDAAAVAALASPLPLYVSARLALPELHAARRAGAHGLLVLHDPAHAAPPLPPQP